MKFSFNIILDWSQIQTLFILDTRRKVKLKNIKIIMYQKIKNSTVKSKFFKQYTQLILKIKMYLNLQLHPEQKYSSHNKIDE